MTTTDVDTMRIKPPEPRNVVLEECEAAIERELGPLSLHQRIAVSRALDRMAAGIEALAPEGCFW